MNFTNHTTQKRRYEAPQLEKFSLHTEQIMQTSGNITGTAEGFSWDDEENEGGE